MSEFLSCHVSYLLGLAAGSGQTDTQHRYLDLFVRDDPGAW